MTLRFRLVISGPLPGTTLELLQSRFHTDDVTKESTSTELTGTVSDQPALRALLGLIWDTGGQVLSLETELQTAAASLARQK